MQARSQGEEDVVVEAFNSLVPAVQARYNSTVGPTLLSRLPSEALPNDARSASAFRSRVSLLVEYSVIRMLADFLEEDTGGRLHGTFNTLNEFADMFIRNDNWEIELRIDIKTLHDLSIEASARFDSLQNEIRPDDDYLFFIAWKWQRTIHLGIDLVMPAMIGGLFIPAIEVAQERDQRQLLAGASFHPTTGVPLAKGGKPDTNFGKMNRIVHPSRRYAPDLAPRIDLLLQLMDVQAEARTEEPVELAEAEALAEVAVGSPDVTETTAEE